MDSQSVTAMTQSPEVPQETRKRICDEINRAELPDIYCPSFIPRMPSPGVPQEGSEQILDNINPVEQLLNIDSLSFMEMMESLDVPVEASKQMLDENNKAAVRDGLFKFHGDDTIA